MHEFRCFKKCCENLCIPFYENKTVIKSSPFALAWLLITIGSRSSIRNNKHLYSQENAQRQRAAHIHITRPDFAFGLVRLVDSGLQSGGSMVKLVNATRQSNYANAAQTSIEHPIENDNAEIKCIVTLVPFNKTSFLWCRYSLGYSEGSFHSNVIASSAR